jgi:hypothetical protein
MRALLLSLAFLMTCSSASGQSINAELMELRELLEIPASTSIIPSTSALPDISPLKVYIATGQDMKVHNSFVKRIGKWNQKNGVRYEALEIVQNLSEADVILAWYSTDVEQRPRPYLMNPDVVNPMCCPKRYHSYLIVRKPEGLEILRRIIIEGYENPGEVERQGDTLRADFFKRLKMRSKNK